MADDLGRTFLDATAAEFRSYKKQADKALAQVTDEALHHVLDEGSNSLAVIVQHVAGNLRSRWTDFLTSDGEKPDRNRDGEFEPRAASREQLLGDWDEGWAKVLGTLETLRPEDLSLTVTIRSEPHPVPKAIQRSLAHTASHVGQIVLLAKHLAGARWTTLSIPRGQSAAFEARTRTKFEGSGRSEEA